MTRMRMVLIALGVYTVLFVLSMPLWAWYASPLHDWPIPWGPLIGLVGVAVLIYFDTSN